LKKDKSTGIQNLRKLKESKTALLAHQIVWHSTIIYPLKFYRRTTKNIWHFDYWDAFSINRLADAVATGNFSRQDQALLDDKAKEMPAYFDTQLRHKKHCF